MITAQNKAEGPSRPPGFNGIRLQERHQISPSFRDSRNHRLERHGAKEVRTHDPASGSFSLTMPLLSTRHPRNRTVKLDESRSRHFAQPSGIPNPNPANLSQRASGSRKPTKISFLTTPRRERWCHICCDSKMTILGSLEKALCKATWPRKTVIKSTLTDPTSMKSSLVRLSKISYSSS
jgi:hypothetical protein